jgi:hypothetical protein
MHSNGSFGSGSKQRFEQQAEGLSAAYQAITEYHGGVLKRGLLPARAPRGGV